MAKTSNPEDLLDRAYNLKSVEDTQALYSDWAATYDATMMDGLGYVTPRKTADLLSRVLPNKEARILDVGSGTGLAGAFLAMHGFTFIDALDYSEEMLAQAEFREIDGRKIYTQTLVADLNGPLKIGSAIYDGLICTGTFTHAHVGASCLDELFRIMKPGAFFACTVHKDVWEEGGFAQKVKDLATKRVSRTHGMTMDIYFETDDEPQGWYLVWEKIE